MKIKFILKSGQDIILPTHAPTMEAFMEDFTLVTSQIFGDKGKYMTKYGEFLDIYSEFIRYSEINVIGEYFD